MGAETALISMGADKAQKLAGMPLTAATTIMSFTQASKQKRAQREAEAKAAEAMAEARKRLEVNFAENLSLQKEPYELAREAMLSQGAQAIQAGVESDRGAEVTAGKVQMAQNEEQAGIRSAMGQEMTNINKQIINEDSRLADLGMQINLEETAGQQLAMRDAEEARAAAITEGMQGIQSLMSQGADMAPLYSKMGEKKQPNNLPQAKVQQLGNPNSLFGPQLPQAGTEYGPLGVNWSGLGYR
jgi:hypothetical protein